MRLRKADIRRRVNGPVEFRFSEKGLTSHAGLELFRLYFDQLDLRGRISRVLAPVLPSSDYGAMQLVVLLLGLLLAGGRRVRHLLYLSGDPIVQRLCGLGKIPTPRSITRWLANFGHSQVEALGRFSSELSAEHVRDLGLRRLTIDIDGTVVSTGLQVEGAERGFNPHQRKKPSYYPITAYEAQSGQILRVMNRAGNVHDGKASLPFLSELFDQLDAQRVVTGPMLEEYRMDGAFFRRDVIETLLARNAEYAIKVPFYHWVGLKALVANNRRWSRVERSVDCFERRHRIEPWGMTLRVVIYRKRVMHPTRKNFQLDLFDPSDGHFEYSAIVTNKTLSGPNLWHFLNGRGTHEKVYAELKNGFAFDTIPSSSYHANSAWQWLSVIAFNLSRSFQAATRAEPRPTNRKRTTVFRYESIFTIRHTLLHRAGLLVRPAGRLTLDLGTNATVKRDFQSITSRLLRAA